jgi:hypothetical protein
MSAKLTPILVAITLMICRAAQGQPAPQPPGGSEGKPVPVTVDNFVRAETDLSFALFVKWGALGKFFHFRDLPLEDAGVRPNRDTLYSVALFDLDAGTVTITLPNAGKRFMSFIVIDEDHYVRMVRYGASSQTLTKEQIGTRYVFTAARTLVNPNDARDAEQAHALQDAIKVSQANPGRFVPANWDPVSQKKIRDALLQLSETLPDLRRAFGSREQVDPIRHLIGTAAGWGGNPDQDAIYLNITPERNDGTVAHRLTVPANVPVDGFWSISVYDAEGHFRKNSFDAYSLNNITAKKDADGSVTVQFGGCDGKMANCLPIMSNWNYMVRLYRPRTEILNGNWKFPEAQPSG